MVLFLVPRERNIQGVNSYISMDSQAKFNSLADRLKTGDHKAGEAIFDHFFSQIYRFLLVRLGHRETAQDLAQDVFLKVVRNIDSFNSGTGDFTPWIWQIARNTLIDYFRQKKPQYLDDLEQHGEAIPDHRDGVHASAELREIMNIVDRLSPEEQELFQLHFVADLSYADLAAITGKTEANLRVAIHRLRQKIIKRHG